MSETDLLPAPSMSPPPGVDVCRALLVYDGAGRELVARLKYRNERASLGWLADGMAGLLHPPEGAVVTWVPTVGRRRRRRGFDQAELLARAVARRWQLPAVPLLRRRSGPPQTGRSRAERLGGVGIEARRELPGRARDGPVPVVLVDDVVTTGATLRCGAQALRAAGATWVGAVVAARTPPHHLRP